MYELFVSGDMGIQNWSGSLSVNGGLVGYKGYDVANGVPLLDSNGKIQVSQLPSSVFEYKGTWNATTNTPYLVNGTGRAGDVYIVSVAGVHNFGAGPIVFLVGDQVLYDGSIWERASGATGTVTSVDMSVPTGLTISGNPITTSGTLAVGLASGYTIPTTAFLSGLVPYTGATQTLDMGAYDVNARGIKINGTNGLGHIDYKHQSSSPTGSASSSTLFANVDGDLSWLNDHSHIMTLSAHANTADRVYTFPDASGTLALTTDINYPVTSVFGRIGAITAQSGDYTTTLVTEGTNLYFTNARAIASTLTGYVSGAGTISATDSILTAIQKLNGNISALVTGVSSVFGRTGVVVAQSGDYTTTLVTEGTNLYFTNARARASLSFTAGSGGYNSTTGVITIPTNNNQITNGANYITLTSLSAGTGISYNSTTGVISSTITQYTDANARAAISLTTTGSSGAATYNSTTGVLNIPNYSETTFGTVTSVALSAPTGFSVSGSPITSSGTLALSFATGYSLPTTASQSNWDTAYSLRITSANAPLSITSNVLSISQANATTNGYLSSTDWNTFNSKQATISLTTTGNSGSSTLVGATLNVPTYTLAGLGGQPQLNGTGFVKASGTTISYDNSTYYLASNPSNYITLTSLSATSPLSYNNTTGAFSISQATTSTNGYLSSTDWNTFNNKQNALTNPVTGTGTSGYHAKFTGSSTIGNGIIYDNGSNVGIGTTSPEQLLTVAGGSISVSGNTGLPRQILELTTASTVSILRASYQGAGSFGDMALWTGGSERMRITSGGNLLIGTTTDAGYKLDVNGTGRFSTLNSGTTLRIGSETDNAMALTVYGGSVSGNSNNTQIRFQGRKAAVDQWAIGNAVATGDNTRNFDIYDLVSSINTLRIAGGTGAATFSSSVTAGGILQVNGANTSTPLGVKTATNQNWRLVDNGGAQFDCVNDALNARVDFRIGSQLYIPASGNVGIGTASPVAKLDISIPSTFTTPGAFASSGINLLDPTNVGVYSQITFGYTPGRSYAAGYMGYVSTSSVSGGFGDLVFGTRPTYDIQPTERMRINSSGNVLIGTSTDNGQGTLQNPGSAFLGGLQFGGITFSSSMSTNKTTTLYYFNGSTATLTLHSTIGCSSYVIIKNGGSGTLTIATSGSDNIMTYGSTSLVSSTTIAAGGQGTFISNGGYVWVRITN